MKVRNGYKATPIGLVPDDWDIHNLSSICLKITDGSHFSPSPESSEYFMASVKDMTSKGFDLSSCKTISPAIFSQLVKQGCKPEVGDVLIAKDGSILDEVFVQTVNQNVAVLSSIAIIRPNQESSCSFYLKQYFSWDQIKERIRNEYTSGSALPRIILKNFRLIKIPLPPLQEQQKIANILSTVDEHIEETETLIEKTKVLKQGMIQRLLTMGIGHTEFKDTEIGRIPAEWEVKLISDFSNIRIGGTPSRNNPDYWDARKDTNNIWVSIRDLSNSGRYIMSSTEHISDLGVVNSNVKPISAGTVVMSFKLSIGKVAIAGCKLYTNEAIAAFELDDKVLPVYLYYVLPSLRYDIDTAVKGSTLNKEKLNNTYCPVPPLPEQHQIASILTTIDDQIDTYQSKLDALTHLKSGLMQQLLTGKIRVKV